MYVKNMRAYSAYFKRYIVTTLVIRELWRITQMLDVALVRHERQIRIHVQDSQLPVNIGTFIIDNQYCCFPCFVSSSLNRLIFFVSNCWVAYYPTLPVSFATRSPRSLIDERGRDPRNVLIALLQGRFAYVSAVNRKQLYTEVQV